MTAPATDAPAASDTGGGVEEGQAPDSSTTTGPAGPGDTDTTDP